MLQIASRYGKILLTGDIEAPAEAWLTHHYGERLQATVLVAAHHGSNTSSTLPFLQQVRPEIVLIPAGAIATASDFPLSRFCSATGRFMPAGTTPPIPGR